MLLFIAIVLYAGTMVVAVVRAATSPEVEIYEAHAYRSLYESGDLLIVVRYELPLETDAGGDAWCAELEDEDGCSVDPPAPTAPASLPRGHAQILLYSGWTGSTGDLEDLVDVPRIDHALGGIYFEPGHGLTWEDTATRICIQASESFFDPALSACMQPRWEAGTAAGDTAAAREALGDDLRQVLLNLELERLYPRGTLVTGAGDITVAGRVFANEAFPIMDRVIPEAFQAAQERILTAGYTPTAGDSALQASISATATVVPMTEHIDIVARTQVGVSGNTLAMFVTLLIGAAFGAIVYRSTEKGVLASYAFFFPMIVGLFFRAPTIAVFMALFAILLVPTASWLLRKVFA